MQRTRGAISGAPTRLAARIAADVFDVSRQEVGAVVTREGRERS